MEHPVVKPDTVPVDKDGRVHVDLACPECGYNVRGIHRDHTCPECGTDVALAEERYLAPKGWRGWKLWKVWTIDPEESRVVGLLLFLVAATVGFGLSPAKPLALILLATTFGASVVALVRTMVEGPRTTVSAMIALAIMLVVSPFMFCVVQGFFELIHV